MQEEHEWATKKVAQAYSLLGIVAIHYDNPYSDSRRKIAQKAYKLQNELHELYNLIKNEGRRDERSTI